MDADFVNSRCDRFLVNSDVLKTTRASNREMMDIVKTQIKYINNEIIEENKKGATVCEVALPITFNIENVQNDDVQRIVYFRILRILDIKKYNVRLRLNDKECVLIIRWDTKENEEAKKTQLQYIQSKIIK